MDNIMAYSIEDACKVCGVGRTKFYELIADQKIKAKKLGRRTLILRTDLEQFLSELDSYPSREGDGHV